MKPRSARHVKGPVMSGAMTQTTVNHDRDGFHDPDSVPVIRWVFPLPVPPPLWLDSPTITLGRDAAADVALLDPRVSRRHAQIKRSGQLWLISDLDSKNGIFIGGKRSKAAALSVGDVIRIGDHVGVYLRAPRDADLSAGTLGPKLYGGFAHRLAVAQAKELAGSTLPIVLDGATGTGKERFAEALHEWSGRSGRFLAINCAVYSKSVAPAELFGYRKGAFTGAEQASSGHIRAAQGGTLLLDELIELPLDVQAMLLRVIENREVLALGETRATPIDVRFVAASQSSLAEAVHQGRFREDLRARLEGAVIALPKLEACKEIVPELFCALHEQHSGKRPHLTSAFAERLCLHDWPMNIRELDTLTRRLALSRQPTDKFEVSLLHALGESPRKASPVATGPAAKAARTSIAAPGRASRAEAQDDREMSALAAALEKCGGNITKAAALLGLSRPKAYRILKRSHSNVGPT